MKNIASALVKAQKAFGPALKTNTNPHFRSKYADLSACVEAVIDALNANGIALIQQTHECQTGVMVETVFVHESGETYSAGKLHVPAAKQDPQGYGSALTYARRYSLMAACGIAPEDDDGNAAAKTPPSRTEVLLRDIPEDRENIIKLAASLATAKWKKGEKDAAYDAASEIVEQEEKLRLWQYLKNESTLRAYLKFRDEQAAKRTQPQTEEEFT